MDKRSWPWKKKSSDKANADKIIDTSESGGAPTASSGTQGDQVCSLAAFFDSLTDLVFEFFDMKMLGLFAFTRSLSTDINCNH